MARYNTEEEKEKRRLIQKKYRDSHKEELRIRRLADKENENARSRDKYQIIKDDPEFKEKRKVARKKSYEKGKEKETLYHVEYYKKTKETRKVVNKQRRLRLQEEFNGLSQYTIIEYGVENLRNNPEIVEILLGIQNIIHLK